MTDTNAAPAEAAGRRDRGVAGLDAIRIARRALSRPDRSPDHPRRQRRARGSARGLAAAAFQPIRGSTVFNHRRSLERTYSGLVPFISSTRKEIMISV